MMEEGDQANDDNDVAGGRKEKPKGIQDCLMTKKIAPK